MHQAACGWGGPRCPHVVTATRRGPKPSGGQGQSRRAVLGSPPAGVRSCISSSSGSSPQPERPPRRSPRGLRVCQDHCRARRWLRAPACSGTAISPPGACRKHIQITPLARRGSRSLWGSQSIPLRAPGVPASVVPGEGVSGGAAPAAPAALRRAPFIRRVSKRSESPGGRAAGAAWDWGESETWRPPESQGCRELPLMFAKPPERQG